MIQQQIAARSTYDVGYRHLSRPEFAKHRYERQKKKRDERKAFRELVKIFSEIFDE